MTEIHEYRYISRADGPELCALFDCGQPATIDATIAHSEPGALVVMHLHYCTEHAPLAAVEVE